MQLLLYQQRFMEKLIDKIHEGEQHILIEGKSGSGKSFTIKQLQIELDKEKYQTIITRKVQTIKSLLILRKKVLP